MANQRVGRTGNPGRRSSVRAGGEPEPWRNIYSLRPRSRPGSKQQKIKNEPGEENRGYMEVVCHFCAIP